MLQDGNYAVVEKYNEQLELNHQMIDRFENVTKYVNHMSNVLEEMYKIQLNNSYTNWEYKLQQKFHYLLDYNIEILKDQIQEIHEIITFGKINVISRYILDGSELEYVRNILNNQKINIKSDEQLYALLNLKAYYNNTNIVLAIEIPQFHQDIFSYYFIKTIPIRNNQRIIINSNNLILSESLYMEINNPCNLVENTYYCNINQLYSTNNSCIPNLILNKDAQCKTTEIEPEDEISHLQPEHLYISSKNGISYTSTCNKNGILYGKKLLKFIDCTIFIKNNQFSSKSKQRLHHITVVQPFDGVNLTTSLEKTLTFQKLEQFNFKNVETINDIQKSLNITNYAASGFSLITIIAIVAIFIYIFRKLNCNKTISNQIRLNVNKDVNNLGREESYPSTTAQAHLNEVLMNSMGSTQEATKA